MTRMPFGKFKGTLIQDVPRDYLEWAFHNLDLREPLRTRIEEVLEHEDDDGTDEEETTPKVDPRLKLSPAAKTMANDLLSAGYRSLCKQHHPDTGGSGKAMQLVNEAMAYLRRTIQ